MNYLENRGLSLSTEKTKVTHISEGFDFLGFNIRQYKKVGNKPILLIKPSESNIKKAKAAIKDIFAQKKDRPAREIIAELTPVINYT